MVLTIEFFPSHEVIRDGLMEYFRKNKRNFVLSFEESSNFFTFNSRSGQGFYINRYDRQIIENVINLLKASGRLPQRQFDIDPNQKALFDNFQTTMIQMVVLEEINHLIRLGVLIEVWLDQDDSRYATNVWPGNQHLLLTQYGRRFIDNVNVVPIEAEKYINLLRMVAEPDDELKAYLSEGLACLRSNLPRAAAVLLRVALEHLLDLITESIVSKLPSESRKKDHRKKVNAVGNNIRDRIEVNLQVLEVNSEFLSDGTQAGRNLKDRLMLQMRPAFHAIRDLGGTAAHPAENIEFENVKTHYDLFATIAYKISMEVIHYISDMP